MWRGQPGGFAAGSTIAINGDYQHRTLDVNADGHHEVYLYRSGAGLLLRSNTSGFTGTTAGPDIAATSRPLAGDFTGDLREDLFACVPGTGADRLYRGTSTGLA